MTDFERLMDLLKVPAEKREELFTEFVNGNLTMCLDFGKDGSISWGTL